MINFGPLANTSFVLSVIATATFVLTAWTSVTLKNKWSLVRAAGFLILAGWTAGSSLEQGDTLVLTGSLLVAGGVTLEQIFIARQNKNARLTRNNALVSDLATPSAEETSVNADNLPAALNSAASQTDQIINSKRTAKLSAGLLSEPLVKLPAARRKKARSIFNVIVGTIVLLLVGWGSYALAKKVLLSQEDFGILSEPLREQPTNITSTASSTPAPSQADPTISPTASPAPEVTARPKVTIKETETGYLNAREGASTATKVIKQIKPGETYDLLEETESGEWVKVQLDEDAAGWVSAKYVQK